MVVVVVVVVVVLVWKESHECVHMIKKMRVQSLNVIIVVRVCISTAGALEHIYDRG